MNEIKNYLNKGNIDFDTGMKLLKKYCINKGIISLVEHRNNLQYLVFELKRLAKNPRLKPVKGHQDIAAYVEVQKETVSTEEEIVDWHKLEHHKNTKYDDMPNDFCRKIYKENMDLYKELQHNHQQMKLANSDEGRASFRQEVLRLEDIISENWKIIDDEILSLSEEDDAVDVEVKESTLRSRITRAIKKEDLSNEELAELRDNYAIAQQKSLVFSDKTNEKLQELGVIEC